MSRFKIGDRVEYCGTGYNRTPRVGTIDAIHETEVRPYSVIWDKVNESVRQSRADYGENDLCFASRTAAIVRASELIDQINALWKGHVPADDPRQSRFNCAVMNLRSYLNQLGDEQ